MRLSKMSRPSIRVFAVDVDGTLLDSSHQLRAEVRDALGELSASGVNIVLATARGPMALREIVRKLSFSPFLVCFSGAWIGKMDRQSLTLTSVLSDKRIAAPSARSILESAFVRNIEPNVFTPEAWRVRTITNEILAESRIVESDPLITLDLLGDEEEPSKIMLMTAEGEAAQELRTIANLVQSLSTATFSKPNYLEIIASETNKAKALVDLTKTLGLSLSQVAAIGDGENDVEMLEEAGLGIAMGNGCERAKLAADWLVGTNNEAGVAQAVRRLIAEDRISNAGSGE
jgi:Cof subfamily protein (haloacid dehalogenase superfamily)